ncbi:hypothetical protein, variant 1 [Aphanomyces astaci]|uniref:Cilia- and flagella-associated protein 157 n=1 Tax=Aphanomyces astaci TaxID=112090 RepID=W4FT82_APHAT|nr:hypothetical protein, variant 1 [Aphanomyces astaci]ETV70667.1 hypothetical protein, variant 1 [Aphanomyces astaci]|eukprot:XP_009839730.1 hypothetical protein, variant 1 [Aphanomyces astaci]
METKPAPAAPSGGMETAVSTVPKIRDIGTIALEALGKIDTVLAFELSVMNDHMKAMEGENALIKAENDMLKAKLVQQKEDEADIYYYLHKKLDANYEVIAQLESDIQTVKLERDAMDKAFHIKQDETQDAFAKEKKELTERIESAEDTLHALEVFRERKIVLEDTIAAMESTLAAEKDNHKKQVVEMERRNVQEKERIKKDMLMKIKENKQNLLARTEDQLDTTTKRTMMENDQMISELQYQSKETEKLLVKYKALETEVVHLRLQLKVNKDTEVEMAKRTHFYQKLIKKLNERVQSDHVAARTHAALTQGQERTKTDVNKANEDMIALLQTKSNGLETQLRTLCAELADARTHVDEARAEKHAMLAQQDDTLRFLSVAIHDITHQLALSGHGHAAPSSLHAWQAGDVIPAKLDDLAPSDVKKVLQMLFGKLHAYQAAIVQTRPVLYPPVVPPSPASSSSLGVELPPLVPAKHRQDQLEILKALATRGDSVQRATRPGNSGCGVLLESPHGVPLRSIAVQTLPEWVGYHTNTYIYITYHHTNIYIYIYIDITT